MIALIAAVALAVQAVTVTAFLRHLSSVHRQHARDRDALENKLMSAFDKPWVDPPAKRESDAQAAEEKRRTDEARRKLVPSPEQHLE